jgi:hypothetical protein
MKKFRFFLLIAFFTITTGSFAQANNPGWEKLNVFAGEWVAQGEGQPGQGEGKFSFKYDLDKKVMVRESISEYPAAGNKPAIIHKDMMVIYSIDNIEALKAIYFDNEGHAINYSVSFSDGDKTIQFVSDALQNVPRFRLTYAFSSNDNMSINFEIAPPGSIENYKSYVKGSAHRMK